jgi:hypothetical protein
MRLDKGVRVFLAVVLGGVMYFALTAPAGADPPTHEPFVNVGGTLPAGIGCAGFAITVTIDVDRQQVTTFFDKNGTPTRQTITGRLILSVANDSTGESRTYRLGGAIHIAFGADGSLTLTLTGNTLVSLFPNDVPPGPSTTKGSGRAVIHIDALFTLVSRTGHVEDVCAELAP